MKAAASLLFVVIGLALGVARLCGQAGLEDDRVMLQGFYWESYRHGHADKFPEYGSKRWYQIVTEQADQIQAARYDLIWLPPPSFAGEHSAGYNPKEYYRLDNAYGSFQQHRAMLEALLARGVEPVADLVLNHRDGSQRWGDFKNPDWPPSAITRQDEAFRHPASELFNTPLEERGAEEERPLEYTAHGGTTYGYDSFRDLDHTNRQVRHDLLVYLLQLRSFGYRGWRYDMVHGYHARWISLYNRVSEPTFSVGEFDWDQHASQRGWVWHSATNPAAQGVERLQSASSVFDFSTQFTLKENKTNKLVWAGFGRGTGMMGDTTDGLPWKNRAVTFLENHDTGYRTNEDGTPQEHHESDSFANTWEVEQGYAYLLTHPGVPCVYWKHHFDWGQDLRHKITALVNARKVAGVTAGSVVHVQQNAMARRVYAAAVEGRHAALYVRIGGNDDDWQPSFSDYHGYREYARGAGWKVWLALPGNPPLRQAPRKSALPVPVYREPSTISIPPAALE